MNLATKIFRRNYAVQDFETHKEWLGQYVRGVLRNRDPLPDVAKPTKNTIILHSGMSGNTWPVFDNLYGVRDELQYIKCDVHQTDLHKLETLEERAHHLKDEIEKAETTEKVNIIAHSIGGLEARLYISKLGGHEKVASLTTIGTPHRGTYYADWAFDCFKTKEVVEEKFKDVLPIESFLLKYITSKYVLEEFNPNTPDHPSVKYYSIGGTKGNKKENKRMKPQNMLVQAWEMILKKEGENDGLVSLTSAKWGEYLYDWTAAHQEQVTWDWEFDGRRSYRNLINTLVSKDL